MLDFLADVSECLEGGLALAGIAGGHVVLEVGDERRPESLGHLRSGDLGDHLRAGVADLLHGGAELVPDAPLDGVADVGVHGDPFLLLVGLDGLVPGVERVLEDETRQASGVEGLGLGGDLVSEGLQEGAEVLLLRLLQLRLRSLTRRGVGAGGGREDRGDVGHVTRPRSPALQKGETPVGNRTLLGA